MSTEIDYYELLEVERTADDGDDQVRLPQARDEIPSRQERRVQGQRSASSRRSAKPMSASRTRRSARPMIASAMPRSRSGGGGGRRRAGFRRLLRHLREHLRRIHGRPARRRRAAAARRRPALRHGDQLEEAFHGKATDDHDRRLGARATPATAPGAEPGHAAQDLQHLRRPRQGARATGLLRRRARPARPATARAR